MVKLLIEIYLLEKKLSKKLKIKKANKIYTNFDDLHFLIDTSIVDRVNNSSVKKYTN